VDGDARRRLAELIVQATQAIIADREQSRDSAAWFAGTGTRSSSVAMA
jgi:hypothetical protein